MPAQTVGFCLAQDRRAAREAAAPRSEEGGDHKLEEAILRGRDSFVRFRPVHKQAHFFKPARLLAVALCKELFLEPLCPALVHVGWGVDVPQIRHLDQRDDVTSIERTSDSRQHKQKQ